MTLGVVPPRIRVAIVDDEPPARRRVRAFLSREPDVEVVGEAKDAASAVDLVHSAKPDVVFLDIRLPDASGFDVIERLEPGRVPVVVFVTAFDQFALRAFDVHALDYLLKPFDESRFAATIERVRAQLRSSDTSDRERLLSAIASLGKNSRAHADRIALRVDGRIRMLPVPEIDFIEADSNHVRVHTRAVTHTLRMTLAALEDQLDPAQFLRISRSAIVRLDRIVELEPLFHGEYMIRLHGGTKLTSGRTYRDRVRSTLGIA